MSNIFDAWFLDWKGLPIIKSNVLASYAHTFWAMLLINLTSFNILLTLSNVEFKSIIGLVKYNLPLNGTLVFSKQ